jgi:acyl-CoA dehydrogenase
MSSADWRSRLEGLLAEHRREQAAESAKPDRIEAARAWHAKLVDNALAAPGWPKSVGGLELSLEDQLDYYPRTRARCRSSSRPH